MEHPVAHDPTVSDRQLSWSSSVLMKALDLHTTSLATMTIARRQRRAHHFAALNKAFPTHKFRPTKRKSDFRMSLFAREGPKPSRASDSMEPLFAWFRRPHHQNCLSAMEGTPVSLLSTPPCSDGQRPSHPDSKWYTSKPDTREGMTPSRASGSMEPLTTWPCTSSPRHHHVNTIDIIH